jgi:hypothetical protein
VTISSGPTLLLQVAAEEATEVAPRYRMGCSPAPAPHLGTNHGHRFTAPIHRNCARLLPSRTQEVRRRVEEVHFHLEDGLMALWKRRTRLEVTHQIAGITRLVSGAMTAGATHIAVEAIPQAAAVTRTAPVLLRAGAIQGVKATQMTAVTLVVEVIHQAEPTHLVGLTLVLIR